MRYTRPKLGSHQVAYKGRRYWVIEISETENFNYYSREDYQYAAWDGNGGYCYALINPTKDGKFVGQIIAHVNMKWHEFSSLEEAALMLAAEADVYYDQIS